MVDLFIFADAAEQLARPGAAQIMNISTLFCKQFMNRVISALCIKTAPRFWKRFLFILLFSTKNLKTNSFAVSRGTKNSLFLW
jgi:hypothetical protein